MEKDNRVETILTRFFCDEHNCEGVVESSDGKILMSNPPQFRHKCNNCGKEYYFPHKYPYTKYKIID